MTPKETQRILAELEKLEASMEEQARSMVEAFTYRKEVKETAVSFTISGLVIAYNRKCAYNQVTKPGSLQEWLQEPRCIPLLFDHHPDLKAGEVKSFTDSETGLMVDAVIDLKTPVGRDCKRLIEAGVLDSFSPHIIYNNRLNKKEVSTGIETIHKIQSLGEISLVLMPADASALLSTAKKTEREKSHIGYRDRLLNVYDVERKLETPKIKEIIFEQLQQARKHC